MGLFHEFPYANFHELNLDWIVKFVKKVRDRLDLIDAAVKNAQDARDASEAYSLDSEAWAVGTKNGEPVDQDAPQHENNSKHWAAEAADSAEISQLRADDAGQSAYEADQYRVEAMKWANGTGTLPTDPQYENNAKYWAEQAAGVGDLTALEARVDNIEKVGFDTVVHFSFTNAQVLASRNMMLLNGGSEAVNYAGTIALYLPWSYGGSNITNGNLRYKPDANTVISAEYNSPRQDNNEGVILLPFSHQIQCVKVIDGQNYAVILLRAFDTNTNSYCADGTTLSSITVTISKVAAISGGGAINTVNVGDNV